jgi:high affinity Mn2+ porin
MPRPHTLAPTVRGTRSVPGALLLLAALAAPARAPGDEASASGPLVAGQVTAIAGTAARLRPERAVSTTATLWLGARLVPDLDVYLSPEMAAGNAPGGGSGLVGPPDADLLATSPPPQLYLARAFLRWAVGLGPERVPGVPIGRGRHLVPRTAPARRLVFTVGALSPAELFDQNAYANDPRTQFTQGAFVNDSTWDVPQDVHGYSRGALASYITPRLGVRAAVFQLGRGPGGSLDWDLSRSRGEVVEAELDPPPLDRAVATVRLRAWRNLGLMGSYRRALEAGSPPDLSSVRRPGAVAWGLGLNAELGNPDRNSGLFLRLSWKDGATEPIASGEADRSASLGGQLAGGRWGRASDAVGLALAWSALSRPHARYLAAGGTDARLGAAGWRSAPERVVEGYYALAPASWATVSAGAQVIVTPGADGGRAPVTLLWLRVHLER